MGAMSFLLILLISLIIEITSSELTFRNSELSRKNLYYPSSDTYSYNHQYQNDEQPSAKHLHKIKKQRKKQLLLCLLGSGRNVPNDLLPEAKFLLPSVIQQTEVNVGNPSGSNHLASPSSYGGGLGNCDHLMNVGVGGSGPSHLGLLSHPLLSGLGGVLGGNKPAPVDEDQNRFYHNINVQRQIIRPLYKSMKAFYRLFR